jgi:uncharacterized protein (DUF2126 family)
MDEAEVEFSHHMQVTRIHESPRVTKPYTEEQWQEVLLWAPPSTASCKLVTCGSPWAASRPSWRWATAMRRMEHRCAGSDQAGLRHRTGPQTPQRIRAWRLPAFRPGQVVPGEQLPRWALSICWRADGRPCWSNPALFADERVPVRYTTDDAERFIRRVVRRLGLTDKHIEPGYEDVFYYLWRERRLPVNVDPFDSRLDDELERARLLRVFSQKLDTVVGYAVPLQARESAAQLAGPCGRPGPGSCATSACT